MEISTKEFADWLNIKEGELIHKYRTTGEVYGIELPPALYHQTGQTRRFRYADVLKFMKELKSHEGKE